MQRINSSIAANWLGEQLTNAKLRLVKKYNNMLAHMHMVYACLGGQTYLCALLQLSLSFAQARFIEFMIRFLVNKLVFIKITVPFIKLQGFSSLSPIVLII